MVFLNAGSAPPKTLMGINGVGWIRAVFGGNQGAPMLARKMRREAGDGCGRVPRIVTNLKEIIMGFKRWVAAATKRSSLGTIAMAFAMAVGGVAVQAQTIKDTKHNLGTSGVKATGQNQFSGTAEICVFCHTPHGADTSAAVPLWNRTLPGPTSFTTYDSLGTSTLDGKTATVGSVSIACLSCHDGATSMSAVINAPGSGKTGDTTWTTGAWTGNNVETTGVMKSGATVITNLGKDLRDDHPIGIQYGGGGLTTSAPTGATKDADFVAPNYNATNKVWWVETTGDATTRQKGDLMLYTRSSVVAGGVQTDGYVGQTLPEPFVECASCHDPHTNANGTFLRMSNAGSAVCLACHIK
jgi:predicted CXXCH cytochrome family protein